MVTGQHRRGDFGLDSGELLRRYCALEQIDPETTMRAFFELYAKREGKPRWHDETRLRQAHEAGSSARSPRRASST